MELEFRYPENEEMLQIAICLTMTTSMNWKLNYENITKNREEVVSS